MYQHNHPWRQLIIGIVIAVFLTGGGLAQESTDWKGRFFTEASKRWEEYLRFAHTLQITSRANVYMGANRSPVTSIHAVIKQNKGVSLRVFYLEEVGSKWEAEVMGANPSYSFKLKRHRPEKGWIITDMNASDQSTTFSDDQRELHEKHLREVCGCLRLEGLWLPMLIHDSDFKITAVKTQEIDGHLVVRFDFDYPKPDKEYRPRGILRIKGGWMVLDPEHDWILREYVVHTGQPERGYIHQTFQIREGTDRHPIITQVAYKLFGKKEGEQQFEIGQNGEVQVEAVERSVVPLEEFTLSAFGLPEPPGIQVEKPRWYLWIALGGVVCLSIAALMRWRYRPVV